MTNPFLKRMSLAGRIAAVGLVFLLTACGPGGGGTGTGPTLDFTSSADGAGKPAGGVAEVSCGLLSLRLEEARVELSNSCGRFVFTGDWAADPNQQVVLSGVLENSTTSSTVPVTLMLQFSATPDNSQSVTVTLTDGLGRTILGPQILGRVAS
jgi:hypothetical protein